MQLIAGPCDSLPAALLHELALRVPGGQPVEPSAIASMWRELPDSTLQTDGSPTCVTGDFDGNGQRDYALMVRDGDSVRLLAFHSVDGGFEMHRMFVQSGREQMLPADPATFALYRVPPGRYEDLFDDEEPLNSRNVAIQCVHFDSSVFIMAWDGQRYRLFWLAD
jgi:hypothetical protein